LAAAVLFRLRVGFRADDAEALEWSAFLCLLMFLSSAPASYQFVVLIAMAVPTASILLRQQGWRAAVVFLCLYLAACNLKTIQLKHQPDILTPFLYLKLWSGVGLIAFYCWILKPPLADGRATIKNLLPSPASGAALIVLGVWIPGAYGAWSHLRTLRPANPISISPDSAYLRISPVSTDTGLMYVAMEPDGYRIQRTELGLPNTTSDQLSFATTPSGRDIWVESNSGGMSRLAQIVPARNETTNCQIDHAETPALSDDGSLLAFVREDQGRGSLWTRDLRHCRDSENGGPQRVTAPPFDVRTVSATVNHTFLIGAVYQGQERVFIVASGKSPQLLAEARGQLDSPALSPDGKALAVRELIAERWQLMLLNLSSRRWEQLTHGDCNAYTPSWKNDRTLLYATDCMRGLGLTALTSLELDR
jgi:WD40-like Beta Propeller Repeat